MNKKIIDHTTVGILFQNSDNVASFHDTVFEVSNNSYMDSQLITIFKALPESIQAIAFEWTLSDTDFNVMAFKFLKTSGVYSNDKQSG